MQFSKIDSVSFCGTINYSTAYFWHFSCFRVITEIKQKPNAVEDAHVGTLKNLKRSWNISKRADYFDVMVNLVQWKFISEQFELQQTERF